MVALLILCFTVFRVTQGGCLLRPIRCTGSLWEGEVGWSGPGVIFVAKVVIMSAAYYDIEATGQAVQLRNMSAHRLTSLQPGHHLQQVNAKLL